MTEKHTQHIFSNPDWASYGLLRGTVRVECNFDQAERLFFLEAVHIESMLSTVNGLTFYIEHIGSTAVKNLPAKPIIDIAVGIQADSVDQALIDILVNGGYNYFGNLRSAGGHVFDKLINGKACVILHLIRYRSFGWKKYIAFREYLRTHAHAREQYSAEKKRLAELYSENRKMYSAEKRKVVILLTKEAFQWQRLNR